MTLPHLIGAAAILLLVSLVLVRIVLLKRRGVAAMKFGSIDKTDFVIPPFALFYVYLICASAFGWPSVLHGAMFSSRWTAWLGVLLCVAAVGLMLWSLTSFGASFRVGIDTEAPDELVTSGAFALTRNPIYVAFALLLAGEFFVFENWLFLAYIAAGFALFHRQVLREEAYLASHYGDAYETYRRRVPRYL
jgi:protein-S-isoprenylcysteine O-methyltransferase Ste14